MENLAICKLLANKLASASAFAGWNWKSSRMMLIFIQDNLDSDTVHRKIG
jgi:hypothetical protein